MGVSLLDSSRLPIIFDLDETLLVAFSLHTIDVKLTRLQEG